jgi:hypothetical protein
MKTLIAAVTVAAAALLAASAFQSANARTWKSGLAAPASAKSAGARSAYAAAFNGPRRVGLSGWTYARNCNVSPASPSYRTNCN